MVWRILRYLHHLFYLKYRKGHGIHSPYLFEFVSGPVFNADRTMVPQKILDAHSRLRKDGTMIPVSRLGAGSKMKPAPERSVGSFVRGSSVDPRYGALLYRIANWFGPEVIIELGTGLGISTAYLSAGCKEARMHTIEGNLHRARYAATLLKDLGAENCEVHTGDLGREMNQILEAVSEPRLLAFVDGNHRYGPAVSYVRRLIRSAGHEGVVIMDDIHWSKDMHAAWSEVVSWPEVRVSIDLFHMGILLLRRDLNKVHMKIKF